MRRKEKRNQSRGEERISGALRRTCHRALLLSCTAIVCGGLALGVYAMDEAQEQALREEFETEAMTEGAHDAAIGELTHAAVDALTVDETEAEPSLAALLLPDEAKEALNSLDEDKIREYAIMIDRVLMNPDFQSLIKYEEVQELIALLLQNGLKTAKDDPVMTKKILETLGVDSRAVVLFFEILRAYDNNPEAVQKVQEFLQTVEGRELLNRILETLNPEIIDALLQEYQAQIG